MKLTPFWFPALICQSLITNTALAQTQLEPPKKLALLVGVNEYLKRGFETLKFAERDAVELGKALDGLGFRTTVLLGSGAGEKSATRENIIKRLDAMLVGVGKNDLVLISFSGHGQQFFAKRHDGKEGDDAYFCPVDAVQLDPESLLSLSWLTDEVLAKRGGRNLLLVDACRDEPQDPNRGSRGVQGKVVALPEDTAILFACRARQRSFERSDAGGGHGLFTYAVLEGLRGEAASKNGELDWNGLVGHVTRAMEEDQFTKFLPKGIKQEPIAAGVVGRISLGRITAAESKTPVKKPYAGVIDEASRMADKKTVEMFKGSSTRPSTRNWLNALDVRTPEEAEKIRTELRKDAEAGDIAAMLRLGHMLVCGDGWTTIDRRQGVQLLKRAAASKDALARWMWAYAAYHYDSERLSVWDRDALIPVAKASFEELKTFDSLGPLGKLYLSYGYTHVDESETFRFQIDRDTILAFMLFQEAAKAGEPDAMARMGSCYPTIGVSSFQTKGLVNFDKQAGLEWDQKAADRGSAKAMASLGERYLSANDGAKAVEWLHHAIKQGEPWAMNRLASCYEDGIGVQKDQSTANYWWKKAAAAGDGGAKAACGFRRLDWTGGG